MNFRMKLFLTISVLFCSIPKINAQDLNDFGMIFTKRDGNGMTFEFRKVANEKYRFVYGLTYNQNEDYYGIRNNSFVYANDSTIVQRVDVSNNREVGLRFGLQNQLGSSVFSMGADLNVAYRNHRTGTFNQTTSLNEDGNWEMNSYTVFPPFENPGGSYVTRHYIVPSLRFVINADVPLGESILVHFEIGQDIGLPVYMGASNVRVQPGTIIGTPPSIFDSYTSIGVGIRYKIGSR